MMLPWIQPLCEQLHDNIESGRLGHAPLLRGAAGSGKRVLAEWLVRRLLCLSPDGPDACGSCESCLRIEKGIHPDLFRLSVLEDKKEIVVDQVREFIASLELTPSLGSRRIGLIVPADALNINAANALLKTLEEPAQEAWLVSVVDHPQRLPATIRSRCQQIVVPLPDRETALAWLTERHADQQATRIEQALALADGAPFRADSWISDTGLETGLAIAELLSSLIQGKAIPTKLPEEWVKDPAGTWAWLARLVRVWMEPDQGAASPLLPDRPRLCAPDAALRLEQCWQQALDGQRMAGKPVRHDWLLWRWLSEWRRLSDSA